MQRQPGQPQEHGDDNLQLQRSHLPWTKVLVIAVLLLVVFCLQCTIWSLEIQISLKRQAQVASVPSSGDDKTQQGRRRDSAASRDTVRSTKVGQRKDLHQLYRARALYATGGTQRTSTDAFWRIAQQHMDWEDPDLWENTLEGVSTSVGSGNATLAIFALKQAAAGGHPTAQYYLACALAAGFWPWNEEAQHLGSPSLQGSSATSTSWDKLHVVDTWSDGRNDQLNQAWLLWHMAAMGGSIEAAMAIASRIEFEAAVTPSSGESSMSLCERRLPYLAAAAHGIVDLLEADPQSRARVDPARDKHLLYQIHLHGGTGSRLDRDNRPDESNDALQFYHVRSADTTNEVEAAQASNMLAQLYHYGLKGVSQNLTLALKYYEQAASLRHWEAAGEAGMMHLWGIGTSRDAKKAHKFFQIGALDSFETCRNRLEQKLRKSKSGGIAEVSPCENTCLTGMGLLNLVGVPMITPVDEEMALQYLNLAKEQGDVDAQFYLAMMTLGWKTHFRPLHSLNMREGGQTLLQELHFPKSQDSIRNHPTATEYQRIVVDLTNAAMKGHLMATHRLALMYENGVKIPNGVKSSEVVQKDCDKASKYYRSIIATSSPHRNKRTRKAYKQYAAGETASALRNYLYAAESGSDLALLNAAFIMEQGECLGLNRIDCSKAAVRLWKAAAAKGYSEASLRVGDFYYYGRLRRTRRDGHVGPLGWAWYLAFPEELLSLIWEYIQRLREHFMPDETQKESGDAAVCPASGDDRTCGAELAPGEDESFDQSVAGDLASAAHYYRMAADRNTSPRAHYNLGFLYEWGLGLKQDFPLAKRHYDLAISHGADEAEVPVSLALFALSLHEYAVKQLMMWSDRLQDASPNDESDASNNNENIATHTSSFAKKTKKDVILSHLFSAESVMILLLTVAAWMLFQMRFYRTNR